MSAAAPEMGVWVKVGLVAFIVAMVVLIVLYHRWLDRRRAPHGDIDDRPASGPLGPSRP